MIGYHAHADPPTLADRLLSLNDSLKGLAGRLKDAIASVVSTVIGQAVRDALRRLLGEPQDRRDEPRPFDRGFGRDERDHYDHRPQRYEDDPWHDDEPWSEEPIRPSHSDEPNRWGDALRTTAQTALWWLRTQPVRRPLLTTTVVALTAGGAALLAGPTLAACVSVIASVASLLLTADSARTAAEMVTSVIR
jgi:hypothetical protein